MDEKVGFICKRGIHITRIPFTGMECNLFSGLFCSSNLLFNIPDIAGAADAKAVCEPFPALAAEDEGPERESGRGVIKGGDTGPSPFPEIRTAEGAARDHPFHARPHARDETGSRGGSQQPVFQAIWGCYEPGEIARCTAIHGNRIPKVRVGVKKCRYDPALRGFCILLYGSDDASLNLDIGRYDIELFTAKDLPGQGLAWGFPGGNSPLYIEKSNIYSWQRSKVEDYSPQRASSTIMRARTGGQFISAPLP